MKNYSWILFDADETLFRFDDFTGLKLLFSRLGVAFTEEDYRVYQAVNKPLWVSYQNGEITAEQLKSRRFTSFENKFDPDDLNRQFLLAMAEICTPIDGALDLLDSLKGKVRLGIITNGFTDLQHVRLRRYGLQNHFDLLVISEQVGYPKPHPAIFDHALSLMGNPSRENVLIVGDNPDSDILGGIKAGLHTCWFNQEKKPAPDGITPHYQVASLGELEKRLRAVYERDVTE